MIFYRDVTEAGLEIDPNKAMHALHRVLRNFKMPGYLGAGVPPQGRDDRRRRRLRPAHPPR